MFSKELEQAITEVSGQCAGDLFGDDESDFAYCLAEVTLGAGRLGMFGYPEAQKELNELLKSKSFHEVCEAAKQIVCY